MMSSRGGPARGIIIPLVDKYGGKRSPDEARIIKEMLEEDVDSFVQTNRIDAPAARDLRNEPLEVQLAVLDRGPLSVCTNPSAALIGRIRDAKRGIHDGRGPSLMGGNSTSHSSHAQGASSGGSSALASAASDPVLMSEVDKFLLDNKLDQGACLSLKSESAEIQKAIIEQGPLFNCTNPSAALMGRIRAAKMGVQPPHFVGNGGAQSQSGQQEPQRLALPAPPGGPEAIAGPDNSSGTGTNGIEDSRLQEEALKAIQQLNAEPREPNVSGAPAAGDVAAIGGMTRTGPVGREEVDRFVMQNRLDDRAAATLRLEPPEVQAVVLDRGSLSDSINPSAALMGRIAQAKLSASAASGGASVGQPAPAASPKIERATPQDVDRFLRENGIDDRAAREFQTETLEVQTAVINRGPLTNCNNPSSALLGRIRDSKRFSAMGPGGLGVGYASVPSVPLVRASPY